MKLMKRYKFFLVTVMLMAIMYLINLDLGRKAVGVSFYSIKEMALIIPPVFILLGLLDIWVPRETMIKYMGEESGLKGILLAFFLGSAAAGPLYAAFPVAAVLMKKGVRFCNIMIFIGAWSTTKIPMLLFEFSALGVKFALTRLLVNIPGIVLIAYILTFIINEEDKVEIYSKAESL